MIDYKSENWETSNVENNQLVTDLFYDMLCAIKTIEPTFLHLSKIDGVSKRTIDKFLWHTSQEFDMSIEEVRVIYREIVGKF